jgi:hypothetical protein
LCDCLSHADGSDTLSTYSVLEWNSSILLKYFTDQGTVDLGDTSSNHPQSKPAAILTQNW